MWTCAECRALISFEKQASHFVIVFRDAWEREFFRFGRSSNSLWAVTDATIVRGCTTNRSNGWWSSRYFSAFLQLLGTLFVQFLLKFPNSRGKSRIIILVGASSHIIGSRILRQDWHIYHGAEWRCTLRTTCSCYVGKRNSAIRISALLLALVNEQQEIGQALQSDHSRTDSGTMSWTVHKCQKSPLHLQFWLLAYPMLCVGWIWDGLWVEHVSIQPCWTLALTDDQDMIEMWERIGRELLLIKEICPGLPDLAWLTLLASLLAFAVLFLAGVRACVGFAIPSSEFLWKNKWYLFAIRPVISSGFVDGTRGRGMVFTWSNNSTFFAFRW